MKLIDISRELFSAPVYPGDPAPRRELVRRIGMGDDCNLSGFYTCCHSATHVDAPSHFIEDGKTVEQLELYRFLGRCTVAEAGGILTGADMDRLLPGCEKMILIKGEGEAFLSESAAFALAQAGVTLVGTDAQSIEPGGGDFAAHRELLGAEIVILEGLDLSGAEPGDYLLAAFPLFLAGAEASPVRAVLMRE
ncbi:MAG: cyclase family protein [Clostridiales bacterium]|nr:cyclase family protein [Clostridiales bacterium]